jgi:hypothetical protein
MSITRVFPGAVGRFAWASAAVLLAIIVLDRINGRLWLSDFRVYWEASGHFLRSEPPYGKAFGLDSGLYKYSPFTLLLFAPWSWLPYPVASVLFALLIAAAMVFGMVRADRIVRDRLLAAPIRPAALWLALLVVIVHLHRELHLGNVNMILLVLLLLAAEQLLRKRAWPAGALIGLVILVKPHFVVLLPILVLHARFREVLHVVATVVIGSMLPAMITGWHTNLALHSDWLRAMAAHNASPFYTGEGPKMATDTIYSVLWQLSGSVLPPTKVSAMIILGTVALGVLFFDRRNRRSAQGSTARDSDLLFTFLWLIALVPSITATDTEHFLLAIPMVAFLLHHMLGSGRSPWLVPVGTIVLLGFGGNWQDLWGPWSGVLADHGVLGAANLLLIGLCAILYGRPPRAFHA